MLVTAGVTAWWVKRHLYASTLKPVELSAVEEEQLKDKIDSIEESVRQGTSPDEEESREIEFTEREINGLFARENPDLADRVAIDLSPGNVGVKVVVPVDEDTPYLGGKTLRLKVGIALGYSEGRATVSVRRVSLGGIPLPNAWIGNIKNKDLVGEFGEEGSFWKTFSDGIEGLEVREGKIWLKLAE